MCTIEVKYLNGLVYAEADDAWRRDKYDNYGNLVEPGKPIQDGGGRSPSRQVREVAADLEHFLRRMLPDHHLGVRTAVVLTHARSKLGRIDAGVDTVTTLSDLEVRHLVDTPGAELSTDEVSDVVGLVQRDHSYHEDRSSGRRRRSRPAT